MYLNWLLPQSLTRTFPVIQIRSGQWDVYLNDPASPSGTCLKRSTSPRGCGPWLVISTTLWTYELGSRGRLVMEEAPWACGTNCDIRRKREGVGKKLGWERVRKRSRRSSWGGVKGLVESFLGSFGISSIGGEQTSLWSSLFWYKTVTN